jgi:hypothetical protein
MIRIQRPAIFNAENYKRDSRLHGNDGAGVGALFPGGRVPRDPYRRLDVCFRDLCICNLMSSPCPLCLCGENFLSLNGLCAVLVAAEGGAVFPW